MKTEIYEDVLKDEPKNAEIESKEYKDWEKRLHNSLGWIEPYCFAKFYLNKKEKAMGDKFDEDVLWDVNDVRGMCEFSSQEHAIIYSVIVQIDERLKRLEKTEEKENDRKK